MTNNTAQNIINSLNILVLQVNRQCNFNCTFCCNNDGKKSKSVPIEKVKELVKTFPNLQQFILTGGETLLFVDYVFAILEFVKKHNKKISIQFNTTGIILTDKILQRLKKYVDVVHISINTLKPDVFEHIKGRSPIFIEILNKNIKRYIEAGFTVIIDNVITKYNVGEVIDIYKKCEKLGVQEYAVSQMIVNGRATLDMMVDFTDFKRMVVDLLAFHKKRIKAGGKMHLELWCLYADKLKEYRNAIIHGEIPKTDTTSCCCGSTMLYVSAEGYIMPCSLGFNHDDFKDCNINNKSITDVLNQKPIFKLINRDVNLCNNKGVCKLFNPRIKGTFYD